MTYEELREQEIQRLLSIAASDGLVGYSRTEAEAQVDKPENSSILRSLAEGVDQLKRTAT